MNISKCSSVSISTKLYLYVSGGSCIKKVYKNDEETTQLYTVAKNVVRQG